MTAETVSATIATRKLVHKRYLVESENAVPEIISGTNVKPMQDDRTWIPILAYSDIRIHGVTKRFHIIEHVQTDVMPTVRFAIAISSVITSDGENATDGAVVVAHDGTAQRYILKRGYENSEGKKVPDVVVWEGQINVNHQYLAYKIDSDRTLKDAEYLRFINIETVSAKGLRRSRDIAAQDMNKTAAMATWSEALDLGSSDNVSAIKKYIRVRMNQMISADLMRVRGQGPIIDDTGTRILVTLSGSMDEHGNARPDITSDVLKSMPKEYAYYDITPESELDDALITTGVHCFLNGLREIPAHPEIPIAFMANIFTSVLTTIEPRFFNVPMLTGIAASGKTRYSNRFDAVQSRTIRDVRKVKPALNLGDTTGTTKGGKYRATEFGGFAIATDDVIKEGDSQLSIQSKSDMVSSLIRSYESGAGALGRVDRAVNDVVSGQSGKMQGNFRILSERPIVGTSTLERIINLPHLNVKWEKGGLFDPEMGRRLNQPANLNAMHHAWSALELYAFTHLELMLNLYEKSENETRKWNVEGRMAERYAAVVAAHMIFAEFIDTHAIKDEKGKAIDTAKLMDHVIATLETCASRQAKQAPSFEDMFRSRIRQMLLAGKISFVGRPSIDVDGVSELMPYTDPFQMLTTVDEKTHIETSIRTFPPNISGLSDLGIKTTEKGQAWDPKGDIAGYVKFPRDGERGGRMQTADGIDTASLWTILIPTTGVLDNLATAMTSFSRNIDGQVFTRKEIINVVTQAKAGKNSVRIRLAIDADGVEHGKQSRVLEIDAEWLFESNDTEDDEES